MGIVCCIYIAWHHVLIKTVGDKSKFVMSLYVSLYLISIAKKSYKLNVRSNGHLTINVGPRAYKNRCWPALTLWPRAYKNQCWPALTSPASRFVPNPLCPKPIRQKLRPLWCFSQIDIYLTLCFSKPTNWCIQLTGSTDRLQPRWSCTKFWSLIISGTTKITIEL